MTENTNPTGETTSTQEGKTFTQEQLNAIVGERLAKEKTKNDAALAEKERELAQRELQLTAKEKLTAKGLPVELMDALNISTPEALDKAITIIESTIDAKLKERPATKFTGFTPHESAHKPLSGDGGIREAFGLPK